MAGPEGAGGAGRTAAPPPPVTQDLEARAEGLRAEVPRLTVELESLSGNLEIEQEIDPQGREAGRLAERVDRLEGRIRSTTRELNAVEAALDGDMEPLRRFEDVRATARARFDEIFGESLRREAVAWGVTTTPPDQALSGVTEGVGSEPRGTGSVTAGEPTIQTVRESNVQEGTLTINGRSFEGCYTAEMGSEPRPGYQRLTGLPASRNSRDVFVPTDSYGAVRAQVLGAERAPGGLGESISFRAE